MTNDAKKSRLIELYRQKEQIESEIRSIESELSENKSNQKQLLHG